MCHNHMIIITHLRNETFIKIQMRKNNNISLPLFIMIMKNNYK